MNAPLCTRRLLRPSALAYFVFWAFVEPVAGARVAAHGASACASSAQRVAAQDAQKQHGLGPDDARDLAVSQDALTRHLQSDLMMDLVEQVLSWVSFPEQIALSSSCESVSLWGAEGPMQLPHADGHVGGMQFFHSGARLLTWTRNTTVTVWELLGGQVLYQWRSRHPIECARVFPGGRRVLACSEVGECVVWSLGSSEAPMTFRSSSVRGVEIFPSGDRVVTWGRGATAITWDAHTGEALCRLRMRTLAISSGVVFPDGERVATGAVISRTVVVWNASSCTRMREFRPFDFVGLVVLQGGDLLLTVGGVMSTVLDTRTGAHLRTLDHRSLLVSSLVFGFASFEHSDRLAVYAGDRVAIWNVSSGDLLRHFVAPDRVHGLAVAAGGKMLVACSFRQAVAWNVATGAQVRLMREPVEQRVVEVRVEEEVIDHCLLAVAPRASWRDLAQAEARG